MAQVHLLCVSESPASTGFAWKFIRATWVGIAEQLATRHLKTAVAFPRPRPDSPVDIGPALTVVLPFRSLLANTIAIIAFALKHRTRIIYFSGGRQSSALFPILRAVGVRRIVVHDHESGHRTPPQGLKRAMKRFLVRLPGWSADTIIAISDYVARRQVEVACVPPDRVRRIWNAVDVAYVDKAPAGDLRSELGLHGDSQVVMCVGRASRAKGMQVLLSAFAQFGVDSENGTVVIVGDGPQLGELGELRSRHPFRDRIHLLGYRDDVVHLIPDADICVVPSLWGEGFGLTIIEAMAARKPVVASRVGAIPEIVVDGETGILIDPGDHQALAEAIQGLLADPLAARRMGQKGRQRVEAEFDFHRYVDAITNTLLEEYS